MNNLHGEIDYAKSLKSLKAKQGEAGEIAYAKSLKSLAKVSEGQNPLLRRGEGCFAFPSARRARAERVWEIHQ